MRAVGPEKVLAGLPTYLGGKRKLARTIFRAIGDTIDKPPTQATLIDPFMGGGSISVLGKALGYRVLANDVSPHSEAVGKALVENSRVQLEPEDVELAITTDPEGWFLPPVGQLKWPDDAREVVAGICKAAETYARPEKRWLLRALAVKTALGISRWGLPRMSVGKKVRDRRYDDLTVAQAKSIGYLTKPRRVALQSAQSMYGAVFSNGRANEMHREDVTDFLAGVQGDVVYLDPPYPGTEGYERNYGGLDSVLENRDYRADTSRFTASWRFLEDVFDAAEHVPVWVLSLGNEEATLGELEQMATKRGREVEAMAISYARLVTLAHAETKARSEEYLLIARRPA